MYTQTYAVIVLGMLISAPSHANGTINAEFEQRKSAISQSFDLNKKDKITTFDHAKQDYLTRFNQVKSELAKTWDNPKLTNKTQWVQYSQNDKIRRIVDFQSNEVTVEIINNNMDENDINTQLTKQIRQLEKQTMNDAIANDRMLTGISRSPNGDLPIFSGLITKEMLENSNKTQYVQKNGAQTSKISMKLPQNLINQRAKSYLPDVLGASQKWNISPALVMAIIHTESHFNPVAQSHIPAYGLMQIVPSSAGKDVTKRYLGEAKVLTPDILFNSSMNIDIGTAYLNILDTQYLKNVNHPKTRIYLSISAYNGGIGAVAKHFSGEPSLSSLAKVVNTLSPEDVYKSLANDFPYKETRNYIQKVNEKTSFYTSYLQSDSI